MSKRKSAISVVSTNLNQYSEATAQAMGATFFAIWSEYRAAHPERFAPEAVCF